MFKLKFNCDAHLSALASEEVQADIQKEDENAIKDALFACACPKIARVVRKGRSRKVADEER